MKEILHSFLLNYLTLMIDQQYQFGRRLLPESNRHNRYTLTKPVFHIADAMSSPRRFFGIKFTQKPPNPFGVGQRCPKESIQTVIDIRIGFRSQAEIEVFHG